MLNIFSWKRYPNLIGRASLIKLLLTDINKKIDFWDTWWQGLPMDNDIDEKALTATFLEMWIPFEKSEMALERLEKYYKEKKWEATDHFVCELYCAPASPFWLSPSYNRDTLRLDFIWFTKNRESPLLDYYPQFLDLFADCDFRLHWGKCLFSVPAKGKEYLKQQYPKWNDFLKLRELLDPDQIFLNNYWKEYLGVERTSKIHHALQNNSVFGIILDPSRSCPIRWPLLFSLAPFRFSEIDNADLKISMELFIEGPIDKAFLEFTHASHGRKWLPYFVGQKRLNKAGKIIVRDDFTLFSREYIYKQFEITENNAKCVVEYTRMSLPFIRSVLQVLDFQKTEDEKIHIKLDIYVLLTNSGKLVRPFLKWFFNDMVSRAAQGYADFIKGKNR